MNSAMIPSPGEDLHGDNRWMCLHNRFVQEAKEKEPEVLFIGDSIIQQLIHSEVWKNLFEPLHCLNFGIGGDQTQNVLWRIEHGELDYMCPKVVVVHVGTNNISHSPKEVADALLEIVRCIQKKLPDAIVILTNLLPRGQFPNPLREKNMQVNELLRTLCHANPKLELVNIDGGFVQTDGTISHRDMYDYLHLTNAGYTKAFERVYDIILETEEQSLLGTTEPGSVTDPHVTTKEISSDIDIANTSVNLA